jgi:hypothetical protein
MSGHKGHKFDKGIWTKSNEYFDLDKSKEEYEDWVQGWVKMMIDIWKEKILKLNIFDTKKLYNDITGQISGSDQMTIVHEFMKYGIYVAAGVGNGYNKENGGYLEILDPSLRKAAHLDRARSRGPRWSTKHMTTGKPRERRDWFAYKYLQSIFKLGEVSRDFYGEAYLGTLSNVVNQLFTAMKRNSSALRNL